MKWLSEPLMPLPVQLALFVDEASYLREMRRLKVKNPPQFVPNDARACCHYFENDKTFCTYVTVCLNREKVAGRSGVEIAAVIVHEAVHVWQECVGYIGEKKPCREFEAYSIQHISEQLMKSYVEQAV